MTDKKQQRINIGNQAKALLDNDLLNRWWEESEAELWKQFKKCGRGEKTLLDLKASIDAHQKMRADFNRYVAVGNHAKQQAAQKAGN